MDAFTYHLDPGHGWLSVDWTHLKALGLNPTDFTRYSYRRHNTFFLEEDCDAPKFLAAWEAKHGCKPELREELVDGEHWIRNLPPIYA